MSYEGEYRQILKRISRSKAVGKDLRIDPTFNMALGSYHILLTSSKDKRLSKRDNREYVLAYVSREAAKYVRKKRSKILDANALFNTTLAEYKLDPKDTHLCNPYGCREAALKILSRRMGEPVESIL